MRFIHVLLILVALECVLFVETGNSALHVSPTTTPVGSPVSITLDGSFGGGGFLRLRIDFGDGSPPVLSPAYTIAGSYSLNASHSYSKVGNYTITGTTTISILAAGTTTSTETQSVLIKQGAATISPGGVPAAELPRGVVGENYEYDLGAAYGSRLTRCRLARGELPPGLVLKNNCDISGIPVQRGGFSFTIQISAPQKTPYVRELALDVAPGALKIEVSPRSLQVTRGEGIDEKVTFAVTHPTVPIQETIRSSRGEFLVNGRVVGSYKVPMSINLNSPPSASSERVKIPPDVMRSARTAGTTRIVYRRIFSGQNLKSGSGEALVRMRTPASGELRFTRLRLFFEQNNRPIILVKRNDRDLTGVLEIHYNGSGTLKGFWRVDGRLLERVQKNIYYGKVLTLKTPKAPPLPTYSEGAHRLQFIITEPESARQGIDFPEAIYHVEAKMAEMLVPITVAAPKSGAELSVSEASFSWTELPKVARYNVEFSEQNEEEPFFTAYTKYGSYHLPEKVFSLKFTAGKTYIWKVKGFTSDGELAGESMEHHFSLAR